MTPRAAPPKLDRLNTLLLFLAAISSGVLGSVVAARMSTEHERRERGRERVIDAASSFLASVEAVSNHLGRIEALSTAEQEAHEESVKKIEALPPDLMARAPELLGSLLDWLEDLNAARRDIVVDDAERGRQGRIGRSRANGLPEPLDYRHGYEPVQAVLVGG